MNFKRFLHLFAAAGIPVAIIFIVFKVSDKPKPRNGFTRMIREDALVKEDVKSIKSSTYYFAGLTDSTIYFANYGESGQLISVNIYLTDFTTDTLNVPDNFRVAWQAAKINVDPPNYYLSEGVTPSIVIGDLSLKEPAAYVTGPVHFNLVWPLSNKSVIVRYIDTKLMSQYFGKLSVVQKLELHTKTILERQQDGIFSVDGNLAYDNFSHRLVYTYFYRNQYLLFDTNLNLLSEARTIDTNRKAKITVPESPFEGRYQMSSPPLLVNKQSCAHKNRLYIRSMLQADNEPANDFKSNAVIDVYDLSKLSYLFSFYIPDGTADKLIDFRVQGNRLVTLYSNCVKTFIIR